MTFYRDGSVDITEENKCVIVENAVTEEEGALRAEITGMSLPNNQEMVALTMR